MHLQNNKILLAHTVIGTSNGVTCWQEINCGVISSQNFVSPKYSLSPYSIPPSCVATSWYDNSIYYIDNIQLVHTTDLLVQEHSRVIGAMSHLAISQGNLANGGYAQENGVWVSGDGIVSLYDVNCERSAWINGTGSVASITADATSVYIADDTNQMIYQCDNTGRQVNYCTYATAGVSSVSKLCAGRNNYVWLLSEDTVALLYFYPEYPVSVVWTKNIEDITSGGYVGFDIDVHAYRNVGYMTCGDTSQSMIVSLPLDGTVTTNDLSSIGVVQIVRACQSPYSTTVLLLTGSMATPLLLQRQEVSRMVVSHTVEIPSVVHTPIVVASGFYFVADNNLTVAQNDALQTVMSGFANDMVCCISANNLYFVQRSTGLVFERGFDTTETKELGISPNGINKICIFNDEIWLSDGKMIWRYNKQLILQGQHTLECTETLLESTMCCDANHIYFGGHNSIFSCQINLPLDTWNVQKLVNKPFVTQGNMLGVIVHNNNLYVADVDVTSTRVFQLHQGGTPHYTLDSMYDGIASMFIGAI